MDQSFERTRWGTWFPGQPVLILAVTSSTAVVGVAILGGSDVLASRHLGTDRRHGEDLTPMISEVLREADVALVDLDHLAVDVGPGRFTGLRVGIATVRTLAFAIDKPVVGISSLEALAATQPGETVTAVIDARRAEVFQQRFRVTPGGSCVALGEASYGPPEEMVKLVETGDVVVGDGADRYSETYATSRSTYVEGVEPMAVHIAKLSAERQPSPGHEVVPVYLRAPDVQVNIKTRHNT